MRILRASLRCWGQNKKGKQMMVLEYFQTSIWPSYNHFSKMSEEIRCLDNRKRNNLCDFYNETFS